ncbi:MAG: hypothetical protein EHM87_19565 [Burkholderiales bacterium]|nr:MAG: hypothetical protein EHM87_19565 [Burkholderiales bacterium]
MSQKVRAVLEKFFLEISVLEIDRRLVNKPEEKDRRRVESISQATKEIAEVYRGRVLSEEEITNLIRLHSTEGFTNIANATYLQLHESRYKKLAKTIRAEILKNFAEVEK